jgi:hypothetical protein
MLIDLNEDTLQDYIKKKVVVQFRHHGVEIANNETKIQKKATENDAITFVLVDAENSLNQEN